MLQLLCNESSNSEAGKMLDLEIAKNCADGEHDGKMVEEHPGVDDKNGSHTDSKDGNKAKGEADWAGQAELPSHVTQTPIEPELALTIAPAIDAHTATEDVVSAAVVAANTRATASIGTSNALGDLSKLPEISRSLIYHFVTSETDFHCVNSECRPPRLLSTISKTIQKEVELYYRCNHRTLMVELNPFKFHHLEDSFPAWSLEEYRAYMAPYIETVTSRVHDLSIVNKVIIHLADDGPDCLTLLYTLALDHTDPTIPGRSDHEPFRLTLEYASAEGDETRDMHNHEYCTRFRTFFRALEMAVYSLLCDVFTQNLPQASSGYQFKKSMGATNHGRHSPATHPNILDFVPGMLSKHMFDLWMSRADYLDFICLIHRFQFSRQTADGEVSTEEFWLDDGEPLTDKDRDNVMGWRAVWETSQCCDLPSNARDLLGTVVRATHTSDIFTCNLASYIDLGKAVFAEKLVELAQAWRDYRDKLSPDALDFGFPSKETVEAFMVEHEMKTRGTDCMGKSGSPG